MNRPLSRSRSRSDSESLDFRQVVFELQESEDYGMGHQWHPRPLQGNICPTCSNSHFPFCAPQKSPFDQNPRFPAPYNQPFQGPGMDMYRGPARPQSHMYPDSRSWDRNSNIGGSGFDGGHVNCDYYNESDERRSKRVRINDMSGSGAYVNGNYLHEEERRLKLIYEHGGVSAGHQPRLMGSVESSGHGAHPRQNEGDWGHNNYPQYVQQIRDAGPVVPKLHHTMYPIPLETKESIRNGHAPPYHSQNYGSSSVSPVSQSTFPIQQKFASPQSNIQGSYNMQVIYPKSHAGMNMVPQNLNQMPVPPPLPLSPPPPQPMEPPRPCPHEQKTSYPTSPVPSSMFPVHLGGSPGVISPSYAPASKEHYSAPQFVHNKIHLSSSAGQMYRAARLTVPHQYGIEEQADISKQWTSNKPKVVDVVHLFKQPHRATRPDHFVIILRGLPGSGKSYLASMLRDVEVENGGEAPRIHSMDEYFMTEVEKPEEYENSKSASSARGKKTTMKKVMEYCYEPEMEEAYRSSMLKAFKKSLEVGEFTFIIVDDRNLRVADFAQFWAIAKRSGYEVYMLEAPYKDPAGCAARNVHNFTQNDIEKMAQEWEEAPSLYVQLDVKSLFHGDNLKETGIEEVDMDMEDDADSDFPDTTERAMGETEPSKIYSRNVDEKQGDDDEVEADHLFISAKEVRRSKWSDDFEDKDLKNKDNEKRNTNELSGLVKTFGKRIKSVRWGDQAKDSGFSIGAAKKATQSLVIGPGPGYNLAANPVQGDALSSVRKNGNKQTVFEERLRAEHKSFKDVFAKRKQKLGFVLQDE